MRKLLLLFVAILVLAPAAAVLAQDAGAVSIDPGAIVQIIQLILPVVLPAVTGALRRLISGLSGPAAFWVNFALNVLAQIIATLNGGDVALAAGMSMMGGAGGSKYIDMAASGVDPVKYAKK